MASARRTYRAGLIGGVVLVALALLWWALAVPALVKYPTDLDVTPRFEGTFTLFVNPQTAAPLAQPQELPLTIERRIQSIGDESSGSKVVVKETIIQKAGSLIDTTETNQYVMDRRSMANVEDGRAYAFEPGNVVDRSESYRLQLPMGTDRDETYQMYKNETGALYNLVGDTGQETREVEGLTLSMFKATGNNVPLSEEYLAQLRKIVPLPETMTLTQLKPILAAGGVDVDKLVAGIVPVLEPADLAALQQALAAPIELQYLTTFDGTVGIESRTGTEVDVERISETISARPQLDLAPLQALLAKYSAQPAVQAAAPVLAGLGTAPPVRLFAYEYGQTDASVADIAGEAKDMRNQILTAERWVPGILLALGLVALLVAAGARMGGSRQTFGRMHVGAPVQAKHA